MLDICIVFFLIHEYVFISFIFFFSPSHGSTMVFFPICFHVTGPLANTSISLLYAGYYVWFGHAIMNCIAISS